MNRVMPPSRRVRIVLTLIAFVLASLFNGLVHGDWTSMGRDLWGAFVVGLEWALAWFIVKWGTGA